MKKELWPELKENPSLAGLPDELKDPSCVKRVEREIQNASATGHKHRKPSEWLKCEHCQKKSKARKDKLRELGFKDYGQFLLWRKIQDIIINKREIWIPKTKA